MDWRAQAACLAEDPELFFPAGEAGPWRSQVAAAKVICQRCVVSDDCLRFALETDQAVGIWGGLLDSERADIRRHSRRPHAVPQPG